MTIRTRIVTVVAAVLLLAGLGAGIQANAEPLSQPSPATETNGCVRVPSLQIGFCLQRF